MLSGFTSRSTISTRWRLINGQSRCPDFLPAGTYTVMNAPDPSYASISRTVIEYVNMSGDRQSRCPAAVSACGYIRKAIGV